MMHGQQNVKFCNAKQATQTNRKELCITLVIYQETNTVVSLKV